MASPLVSPGVSVVISDESFYIPVSAPTVPLFFIATEANKTQPNGISLATGTAEHDVVRTVTSIGQSVSLYGIPKFRTSSSGAALHGDARNEYGLFALNQFLGLGNLAYVVRANIDLADKTSDVITFGLPTVSNVTFVGETFGTVSGFAVHTGATYASYRLEYVPPVTTAQADTFNVFGVDALNVKTFIGNATVGVSFTSLEVSLTVHSGSEAFISGDYFTVTTAGVDTLHTTKTLGSVNGITAVDERTVIETYTLVALDPDKFTVTGSLSGLIGIATVGAEFNSGKIKFTINHGSVAFKAGDYFTFDLENLADFIPVAASVGKISNLQLGPLVGSLTFPTASSTIDVTIQITAPTIGTTPATFTISAAGGQFVEPAPNGTVGSFYSGDYLTFFIEEDPTHPYVAGDEFSITLKKVHLDAPLGLNDAAKRVAISTALQATINSNQEVRSVELYEYNLILAPGYHEVVDELVSLVTDYQEEAFVIADTPCDKSPEFVVNWMKTTEAQAFRSVAYYYPWTIVSNLDGANCLVAPSGTAVRTYAYSDNVSQLWFAPAGFNRGIVSGVSKVGFVTGTLGTATTFVEANLNQGQRDNLYQNGNLNPIVFFPNRGFVIWGQKTRAPVASALDRINVMRLLAYIKRSLRKGSLPFIFEPNDTLTRANLKSAVDGFLTDIMSKRGLYDFATICDASNNTPDRVDRNELYLDCALKPVKAVEFVYIPIRVLSTGAKMGTF